LDIYGDRTTVVWQEEVSPSIYQIVKKTKGPLGWPKSQLHLLWTEEMLADETKGTVRPPAKNLVIIVDAVPYYYVDAGTEESVVYTTQRKAAYYYGSQPDYTVDYHPLQLRYSFPGLNPQKDYLIKVTYYHESDKPVTQTLAVDNTLNIASSIEPKTRVTTESWISSNCRKDGKIDVTITKSSGDYAVCSVIALYEFDADYSKSGGDVVASSEKTLVPYNYELMQSYPNPTTGKAAIKYQLAQPGKVSLKIYNTLGQVVKTLVSQNQAAGYYNVAWDGKDNAGKAAANGVYIYRLEAGDYKATRKMAMIK
jgi:hypothetical protein